MHTYSVHQAKTHLSKILAQLKMDDEVIITCYGKPVARVIPYETPKIKREFGILKDQIQIDESFFDELPEEELSAWNE